MTATPGESLLDLRSRHEQVAETLQNLELAARQRLWDGRVLLRARRFDGGVYLSGYAAEMTLKVATFKLDGCLPGFPVGACLTSLRQNWMARHMPAIKDQHESLHSLWFWIQVIRGKRRYLGLVVDRSIDMRAAKCATRLYRTWWTGMRYRPNKASSAEAWRAYDDALWLYDHRAQFWS